MTPLLPMASAQAVSQIPLVILPLTPGTWCWPHLHPGNPYPEQWSSTTCQEHDARFEMHFTARRCAQDGKE